MLPPFKWIPDGIVISVGKRLVCLEKLIFGSFLAISGAWHLNRSADYYSNTSHASPRALYCPSACFMQTA